MAFGQKVARLQPGFCSPGLATIPGAVSDSGTVQAVAGNVRSAPTPPGVAPDGADWGFARRPFWLFSHVFAASVVTLFVVLGLWQLARLGERQELNEVIGARSSAAIELTAGADLGGGPDQLDYQAIRATVRIVDPDFVRVGNRSQGGAAGEHVVAIAELADGTPIAVNRGFVPANAEVPLEPLPTGPVEIDGWLRATVTRGNFGATDLGTGTVLPRLDTERVGFRLGAELPALWIQLAPPAEWALGAFPDPIALPAIDEGPHRSYAIQWFTFATLGVGFYLALLWRQARGAPAVSVVDVPEPAESSGP